MLPMCVSEAEKESLTSVPRCILPNNLASKTRYSITVINAGTLLRVFDFSSACTAILNEGGSVRHSLLSRGMGQDSERRTSQTGDGI